MLRQPQLIRGRGILSSIGNLARTHLLPALKNYVSSGQAATHAKSALGALVDMGAKRLTEHVDPEAAKAKPAAAQVPTSTPVAAMKDAEPRPPPVPRKAPLSKDNRKQLNKLLGEGLRTYDENEDDHPRKKGPRRLQDRR